MAKDRVIKVRIAEAGYVSNGYGAHREGVTVSVMVRKMLRFAHAEMKLPLPREPDPFA